jgi:hypothetical protein
MRITQAPCTLALQNQPKFMKLGFFWATLFWTPIFHHFGPFWMTFGSPRGAKYAYYRGATHFLLFREIWYFRPKCCFTEAPCTSISVETLFLTCSFQLLGALLGAPERRLGGKCAYYRGETLIIEGNVCFASVIRTFGEPPGPCTTSGQATWLLDAPLGSPRPLV